MFSVRQDLRYILKKGLAQIIGSTFLNKVIGFITNVALVRILTKGDYGIYTSAFNIYLIIDLFSGFGITNSILFFASDKEIDYKREAYYRFCAMFGIAIDIVLFGITLLYAKFGHFGIGASRQYVYMLSLLPLFEFCQNYFSIVLRSRKENKKYSHLLNIASISYAIFAILGSIFWGVTGTILGRYLSFALSMVVGFYWCRKYYSKTHKLFGDLTRRNRIDLVKYAIPCGGVTALNNILYKIDIMLIGSLIGSAELLASYKTATIIPENMNFFPQSVMVFALPLFIEHNSNGKWLKEKSSKLFILMAGISLLLLLILFFGAPLIIKLLWGKQYLDSIPYFRILAISFFFISTFRITSTNILVSLGKVNFNLIVAILSGIANIILDYFMVRYYGAMGAAFATLIIAVFASALSFPYLIKQIRTIH